MQMAVMCVTLHALILPTLCTSLVRGSEEISTFKPQTFGDPRPGFANNRIVRVSRGPNMGGYDDEISNLLIKSPAYQLKYRPGKLSSFHGDIPGVSSGFSPASHGFTGMHLPGVALGPGVFGGSKSFDWTNDYGGIPGTSGGEREFPTYTPMIGARALSNMEKFFEHVRENIHAVRNADSDEPSNQGPNGDDDVDERPFPETPYDSTASELTDFQNDEPNQGKEITMGLRWLPPASGIIGRNNYQRYNIRKARDSTS